jgi:type II secretory pathway pseudopilin PulG
MVICFGKATGCKSGVACGAFTLMEVLIGFFIFGLVTSGMIYGYVEANRMAEWSSQSLAATSYAIQGMEQMRSAQWEEEEYSSGQAVDILKQRMMIQADGTFAYWTNQVDTLDIPTSGALINVTNYLYVTPLTTNPPLRRIVSQVVWSFRLTGRVFTNTVVTLRAADQLQ